MRLCGIDGCDRKYSAKGLCAWHYLRFKRNGDPNIAKNRWTDHYFSLEDYLNKNHQKHSNGCWIWIGNKTQKGYGWTGSYSEAKKFKIYRAHRLSYHFYKNEIPDGMFVLHSCDNPSCINPEHLFLGTHEDNMKDRELKNRTHRGIGEKNSHSKLTKEQAIYIMKNIYKKSAYELSIEFGVCEDTVRNIWHGRTHYIEPEVVKKIFKELNHEEILK